MKNKGDWERKMAKIDNEKGKERRSRITRTLEKKKKVSGGNREEKEERKVKIERIEN